MLNAGIDIGSRTIKLVVIEDGEIAVVRKAFTSYNPVAVCRELLEDVRYDSLTATGYGRHIFGKYFDCTIISEIKAFATGGTALFPGCRAILDIGGQDTKVISLADSGRVLKFEMNDKCAAGTGRFLEVMAGAVDYGIEEFGEAALRAEKAARISSMCTVFAESEVISLLTSGNHRDEVALGIHEAIAKRVLAMLGRLPVFDRLIFAGGVAQNSCMKYLLERNLNATVLIPYEPQIVGALGAALSGDEGR